MKSSKHQEENKREKTNEHIFAFFHLRTFCIFGSITNACPNFERVGKVVSVRTSKRVYFFPRGFGFHSLSNVNDAAHLWRNVKQAEGNTLHLLPFAIHACLIKNDFYATDLSLSVSLDVLEIMARIAVAIYIAVFDVRPQMTVDLRLNRGKRKYCTGHTPTHTLTHAHAINA